MEASAKGHPEEVASKAYQLQRRKSELPQDLLTTQALHGHRRATDELNTQQETERPS